MVCCRKLNNTSGSVSIFYLKSKQFNRSILSDYAQREERRSTSCAPSLSSLVLFYAFFVHWSIKANIKNFCILVIFRALKMAFYDSNALLHYLCQKMYFCAKRASKIIDPPKEILLSFSIGTFLTNYDITCKKATNVANTRMI